MLVLYLCVHVYLQYHSYVLILQIVDVNLTSEGKTKLVLGESISFSYQVNNALVYVRVYICMYMHMCVCMCVHVCVSVCVCVCACMYICMFMMDSCMRCNNLCSILCLGSVESFSHSFSVKI